MPRKTLRELWDAYETGVLDTIDADNGTHDASKCTFYAAAQAVLGNLPQMAMKVPVIAEHVRALQNELKKFEAALRAEKPTGDTDQGSH